MMKGGRNFCGYSDCLKFIDDKYTKYDNEKDGMRTCACVLKLNVN